MGGKTTAMPPPRPYRPVYNERLLVTKHALQMELPDKVMVYDIQEIFIHPTERQWAVHGSANNKAFTIKLEPTQDNKFPYDEALQKLRVFA